MRQNRFEIEVESRMENLIIIDDFVRNSLEQLGDLPPKTGPVIMLV